VTDWPFWVQVSDREVEGEWAWPSGDKLSYDPWAEGEPNDHDDGEDCAALNWHEVGAWNDLGCGQSVGFICEFPAIDSVPSP
jgi:hypothetical protein